MMRLLALTTLLAAFAVATPSLAQSCAPEWSTGFTLPSPDKSVNAALQWNDGSGPALFVGGDFSVIDGKPARGVARYTEAEGWNNLGGGLVGAPNVPHHAQCFAVFDEGSGPALYMGGEFTSVSGVPCSNIARWNGTSWSAVGAGFHFPLAFYDFVYALAVHDDGSGPKLYAAGRFTDSGGVPLGLIARWDGASWSAVGGGIGGTLGESVKALAVYDDGSGAGPMLYAGGAFATAEGQSAPSLARWNGTNWSPAGSGADNEVLALRVFDFGSGPRLYAGGSFAWIDGGPANRIAAWDGQHWSAVGNGTSQGVASMASFDAGSGPELYVSTNAARVKKLVGSNLVDVAGGPLSSGGGTPVCEPFDLGTGTKLFVGGNFFDLSSAELKHGVTYDGSRWGSLSYARGGLAQVDAHGTAAAFQTVHHGGTIGTRSYVAGTFDVAGGVVAHGIAGFDGEHWSWIGDLAGDLERGAALAEFDFGDGPELVVGGPFVSAGGVTSAGCARFNGVTWSSMTHVTFKVRGFAIHDDGSGSGPLLCAFGSSSPGLGNNSVARYEGTQWVTLGNTSGTYNTADALESFDDGTGAKLYATFRQATAPLDRVRRWDGTSWISIGVGLGANDYALKLEAFDDGSGPRLYAGVGSQVWRWDGAAWQFQFTAPAGPNALFAYDDGTGSRLYVGCNSHSSPQPPWGLFRWNGTSLTPVAGGTWGHVSAIGMLEEPNGRALYIGGGLDTVVKADGQPMTSVGIARWASPCPSSGVTFCAGDGSANACPCGNAGASGFGCGNSVYVSGARLSASGEARLTQDTALLVGETMPDGPLLYFQGTTIAAPFVFGDGLKCTSGALIRLGIVFNAGGASQYPAASGSLATSGLVFAPGTRHYQARYRDSAVFCSADTFNYTNGVSLTWTP